MTSIDRRSFLKMAAGTISAGLSTQALPLSVRRALATPPNRATGTIKDIEHVVILMQENRSFDHYFGSLRGVRGFADPRPFQFPDGRPVWYQPNATVYTKLFQSRGVAVDAPYVLPFHVDTQRNGDHQHGTDHSWSSGHLAWNNGKFNQWVNQKQDALTMGYLRREDLSFHYALADAFTVCDSYFSSVHADTAINRIFLWSGTADVRNRLGKKSNGPGLAMRPNVDGYTWKTYPERLQAHGISWRLYQGGSGEPGTPTDNFTDNSLEFFAAYQVAEGADPNSPLVRNGVSQHTLKDLREDVMQDRLPQVSWIVSPFKYSEHPDASAVDGATYINLVLEALTANPESWSKTALFLCYDENDGLFDHIVPPMPPPDSHRNSHGMVSPSLVESLQDEFLDMDVHTSMIHPLIPGADPAGRQPLGLGVRVPMIVISPWTTGGWVCSQTFDHTSILQFLEARFGVAEPNISAWRRSICGDLTSAFDFAGEPQTAVPSFHLPPAHPDAHAPITVPAEPSLPTQEAGLRPARAIPYQWTVHHRLDLRVQRSWLEFSNTGRAGAAFYAYDNTAPDTAPRRYTIAARDTLTDYWPLQTKDIGYDVTVYGPNGYLFHARGEGGSTTSVTNDLEVQLRPDPNHRSIRVLMKNKGTLACLATVNNAYSSVAVRQSVAPDTTIESVCELNASNGWYDISVTHDTSTSYLRRFAGHLENGKPSTSDPRPGA
jgi:phospholipase C